MIKFLLYVFVASLAFAVFGPIGLLVCLGLMFFGGNKE